MFVPTCLHSGARWAQGGETVPYAPARGQNTDDMLRVRTHNVHGGVGRAICTRLLVQHMAGVGGKVPHAALLLLLQEGCSQHPCCPHPQCSGMHIGFLCVGCVWTLQPVVEPSSLWRQASSAFSHDRHFSWSLAFSPWSTSCWGCHVVCTRAEQQKKQHHHCNPPCPVINLAAKYAPPCVLQGCFAIDGCHTQTWNCFWKLVNSGQSVPLDIYSSWRC